MSGYDINIQPARQNASVQSKIFANDSLDPVSRYGLPYFFRYRNAKARYRKLVFSGNEYKVIAVIAGPFF
jgi:hypothetical protein